MPGHAGSPYWTAVDFDSETDEDISSVSNHRSYMDPWSREATNAVQTDTTESSSGDQFNSLAGEPVSGSFYYVPTKTDEPEDCDAVISTKSATPDETEPEFVYGRRISRNAYPHIEASLDMYDDYLTRNRRRSLYIEEPLYGIPPQQPMMYEPIYGLMMPAPIPAYAAPRSRFSIAHYPDYGYGDYIRTRKHSRFPDSYDHPVYESMCPDYEEWGRAPLRKAAPENFHLSRYGHLQIDYSCSWNSLDRLIRNQ